MEKVETSLVESVLLSPFRFLLFPFYFFPLVYSVRGASTAARGARFKFLRKGSSAAITAA
jgi:hypothetical protein